MNYKQALVSTVLMVLGYIGYGQKPTEVPRQQDSPVDFSKTENIVLFIVLPIIIICLYFVWRRKKLNDKNDIN